jgi:hypothetical protein
MMTIKAGRPVVKLAAACYRANLPLLLVGPHGVGKSELIQQAAGELEINSAVYDLSIMDPTDLVGLPAKRGGKTVYCPPASLPDSGRGFLVFEELNRAPRHMQAPCLQLLTARRLNDYRLPDGWLPVAAINPPEDGYDVVDLDAALLSRFVKAGVVADRDEWLYWAQGQNVHTDVLAYAGADASVFAAPNSNPRAWKYVSDLLRANAGGTRPQTLKVAVSGLVGGARAASFFRFLKDRVRPLTAGEVVDAYASHRPRVRGWAAGGKLDLVRGTLWAVKTHLQSENNFESVKGDPEAWRNLGSFLKDLPGDLCEEARHFFRERGYPLPFTGRKAT